MPASIHILLTGNHVNIQYMPGFAPAGEVLLFRQKDPKPVAPRPASSDETNAGQERAGQLALLKQGPPVDGSVRLWDRSAGAGQGEKGGLIGLESPTMLFRICWGVSRLAGNERWCLAQPTRFQKLFGITIVAEGNFFRDLSRFQSNSRRHR
jgi:hypothetical protein